MTDLEIDRALALAIGWTEDRMTILSGQLVLAYTIGPECLSYSRVFSHKDWNVIGPIAELYNVFPYRWHDGRWGAPRFTILHYADTPQKAIALAVIAERGCHEK